MTHHSRKDRIIQKLQTLSPNYLELINNSAAHQGHAGNIGGDDTHFTLKISSTQLDNMSRLERHKIINNLLKEEFDNGLHALSIRVIHT